jgi:hypothetical protein
MRETGAPSMRTRVAPIRPDQFPQRSSGTPIDLVYLGPLMARTAGSPEIIVGLIDGPIARDHPDLVDARISELPGSPRSKDTRAVDGARHGTFLAGMLSARRGSGAPAICPNCTLLLRPIFGEPIAADGGAPGATPEELAAAIVACIEAGSRVLNLSLAFEHLSSKRPEVTKRSDLTHKRTNHELRPPYERHRARP